jgi:hypothetical protein
VCGTHETSKNNTYNLQHETTCYNIKLKQLKHFGTYSCNICVKHMQHLDQKRLQHMSGNRLNTLNKRLQRASETLAIYATSPTYFCIIKIEQLQHIHLKHLKN